LAAKEAERPDGEEEGLDATGGNELDKGDDSRPDRRSTTWLMTAKRKGSHGRRGLSPVRKWESESMSLVSKIGMRRIQDRMTIKILTKGREFLASTAGSNAGQTPERLSHAFGSVQKA
jgi:hypothetical protein